MFNQKVLIKINLSDKERTKKGKKMRSFANYMTVMFMIMFWAFRIVVAVMAGMNNSFIVSPLDNTIEIILLFITLVCIALVIKRKLFGGVLYFASYIGYFGVDLYNKAIKPLLNGDEMTIASGLSTFVSLLAVILAIVVLMDLLADRTKRPADKKTEWFYASKETDRQLDERADKNNYRTL